MAGESQFGQIGGSGDAGSEEVAGPDAARFQGGAGENPGIPSILGAQNLLRLGLTGLMWNPTLASPHQGQRKCSGVCVSKG